MTVPAHRERPTPDQIAELPAFDALPLERIKVVRDAEQAERALRAIERAGVVGFDTEAKPTFTRDAVRDGPHVIQLATADEAYIVQVAAVTPVEFLRAVLESPTIVKVGFGLDSDEGPLRRKLGIGLFTTVDLSQALRRLGFKQALGAKVAVAVVLGRRLHKSKTVTTSNWALPQLSSAQLVYAANDAYAAFKVYEAMPDPDAAIGRAADDVPARTTESRHDRSAPHRIDRPAIE